LFRLCFVVFRAFLLVYSRSPFLCLKDTEEFLSCKGLYVSLLFPTFARLVSRSLPFYKQNITRTFPISRVNIFHKCFAIFQRICQGLEREMLCICSNPLYMAPLVYANRFGKGWNEERLGLFFQSLFLYYLKLNLRV